MTDTNYIGRATFSSRFTFGDLVSIDGDSTIKAVVTGLSFHERSYEVEVAWFSDGTHQTAWISESRLKLRGKNGGPS